MKILKVLTLRGPNQWHIQRHQLIVVRLDLETSALTPPKSIPNFYSNLAKILPSLEQNELYIFFEVDGKCHHG